MGIHSTNTNFTTKMNMFKQIRASVKRVTNPGKNRSKTDARTRIIIVVDETGSMSSHTDVTISSYNEWLDSNRTKEESEDDFPRFTLVKFNTSSSLAEYESVEKAPRLTKENYSPNDMTALHDAIGSTINSYRDERNNIMVIITDGHENNGWIFHYLGANQDSWAVGSAIGIKDEKFCNSYTADTDGFDHVWAQQAVQTRAYRSYNAKRSKGIAVESLDELVVPSVDKESYISSKKSSKW